jgi:hypothetical protein
MNTRFQNFSDASTVYVRPILVVDLPDDLRDQVEGLDIIYSIHRANGDRVALVANRQLAFALAAQNDMAAVSVH